MKIFIDIGHRCPPKDRGAIGCVQEEDVVYAVGKELGDILQQRGCEVLFSKPTDGTSVKASLSQRVAQSNKFNPDLFVSLHCNAYATTSKPMGTEVFAASTKGDAFAAGVLKNIVNLGFSVHAEGIRDGSRYYVIRNTQDPAILIEMFFVDSEFDVDLYSKVGARGMALAIADGIIAAKLSPKPVVTPIVTTDAGGATEKVRAGYLIDAAKFYKAEDHQTSAWLYLQQQVPDSAMLKFKNTYSPKRVAATESVRPKFDPHNIDWSNPNCRISEYFTVLEATKGDPDRTPKVGSQQEKNILALASELDKLRKAYGHPIGVTSWYRPSAINEAVGGVPDSQHIEGLAADVYPLAGMDVDDFQAWCQQVWFGRLGRGVKKGFVHLDIANRKGFMTGGEKGEQWDY